MSFWFCRELFVLPWGFCFCREFLVSPWVFCFAVSFMVSPWAFLFCRELYGFAVSILVLPWAFWFCRAEFDIAATVLVLPWGICYCRDSCGPPYQETSIHIHAYGEFGFCQRVRGRGEKKVKRNCKLKASKLSATTNPQKRECIDLLLHSFEFICSWYQKQKHVTHPHLDSTCAIKQRRQGGSIMKSTQRKFNIHTLWTLHIFKFSSWTLNILYPRPSSKTQLVHGWFLRENYL